MGVETYHTPAVQSIVARRAKWTDCGESDATAGSVFLDCSPDKRGFLRRAGVFLGAFGLGVIGNSFRVECTQHRPNLCHVSKVCRVSLVGTHSGKISFSGFFC
ncbi:hypothetical protein L596_002652 [Steinernema carpocapsae]|uniref:Uncharacterized protein n=1 Tax=Steinernema carpocapsae TaxID=34508 RepID=A0A4U8UQD1_STECR|nr:hypothetical protein L596_002652 [Steinernema carpocapsae]